MYQRFPLHTDVIHPDEHHHINCISIDPEFRNLIPAISDDERRQLEANIVAADGVRDPLTLWLRSDNDWVILDGHNRFEICRRRQLPFPYHEVEFDTRDEAADWIDRNQLGRRNLSDEGRKILLGRLYNRTKKANHDGGKGKTRSGDQTEHHSEKTAERIAREQGVSAATVRRNGKLQAAAATLGIEQEIVAGEIKASESEIVHAAAALPADPTPGDIERAREAVKASASNRRKGKQANNPTAGESRRKNGAAAARITTALITLRNAVDSLAETDSAYRDQSLAELQRYVSHLSRPQATAAAQSGKARPDDELRAAVVKRWGAMREWDKHWGIADMKDVRRLFIEVIRDEQKEFDK